MDGDIDDAQHAQRTNRVLLSEAAAHSSSSSSSLSSSSSGAVLHLLSLEDLVSTAFPSRKDAVDALRLYEFRTHTARMVYDQSSGGGSGGVYFCSSPSCTVKYTVRVSNTAKYGEWWFITWKAGGSHISCRPLSARPFRLAVVAKLSGVRAQLSCQTNRVQTSKVPPSAIKAAALVHDGVSLSSSDVSRVKAITRQELTDIAMMGYKKVDWYCFDLVSKNPGTVCYTAVRDLRTKEITDIRYSWSETTKETTKTATLPSSPQTLVSVLVVPRSSVAIVTFNDGPVFGDFARMLHADGEANVCEFVLAMQLCNKDVTIMYGLFEGSECGAYWDYVRSIMRTDLPSLNGPTRIFGSDRAWRERRKFHAQNGMYANCCNVHFIRNIADADPMLWRAGGKEAVKKFMYARSYTALNAARHVLQTKFLPLWTYMVNSEAEEGVFTANEVASFGFLSESYTLMSLAQYCRLTKAAWAHHKLGEPPIQSDNTVEQTFAADKKTGLRFQGPLEFLVGKANQVADVLYNMSIAIEKWPHALVPEVHRVYVHAKSRAPFWEVASRGLFGHRVVRNRLDRKDVVINIFTHTCNGDGEDCVRPAITKEKCEHLICGLADDKITDSTTFFEDCFPRYYQSAPLRNLLRDPTMAFTAPNLDECPVSSTLTIQPPPVGKTSVPGRRNTNSDRWRSVGEQHV
jgi:hypothetical protein